jgi:para-aminobenzoate synthetase component I
MEAYPANFVVFPHAEGFNMCELTEAKDYVTNSFVCLQYVHPERTKPAPRFFHTGKSKNLALEADGDQTPVTLKAATSKHEYINHVTMLKEEIQQGNIYEVNYCIEFYAEQIVIDPLTVFKRLQLFSKAPYAALVKLDQDYIICASPELFLRKQGNSLFSKPIKGTARRDADPANDRQLRDNLINSIKERTENVMAVDVARNDLSQVATRGSVHVNKLYNIESYENVHQMVSTVSCKLRAETGFGDIIRATFPMASMTGAPKISAMDLIGRHENFRRKYYSGTMGFIDGKGDFELWVVIRSIFYNAQTGRLSIAVGGAITWLSDPQTEYHECLLKAQTMLKALNAEVE